MLFPKGVLVYNNLSTAFTQIDQFIEKLQSKQFSGYCCISFWEYEGFLFFDTGRIVHALEKRGMQNRSGLGVVKSILSKGREKDGEIHVHDLPVAKIEAILAVRNAVPRYKRLSTDLTSLDKMLSLINRKQLSGFIEILLDHDTGIASLFFSAGDVTDILFAPSNSMTIGEPRTLDELDRLCKSSGAVFNVYQSDDAGNAIQQELPEQNEVPKDVQKMFEAILIALEKTIDQNLKKTSFQSLLKKTLSHYADSYGFLDPFIGDFKYSRKGMSYTGNANYGEFVDGLCRLIAGIVDSASTIIPRETLLPQLSRALEPVSIIYPQLVEQSGLESRLPELFKDDSFIGELKSEEGRLKNRKVLNLQGIGISDIGAESILKEFYRTISAVKEHYVDPQQNIIRYSQLKNSLEYQKFQTATAFLQQFDPAALGSRDLQLSFWINLYNFLTIDAIIKYHIPTSVREEKDFFTKTTYRLGEYLFSLDDIEHGILRNNQYRPSASSRQLSDADPRQKFRISPPDIRVHCCLCRAAKSGPSLALYKPKHLDRQLDDAVRRYLHTNGMRIARKQGEIWLSRSFYWYRKDFERNSHSLLNFISKALQGNEFGTYIQEQHKSLSLRFMDYDWSLNGK